MTADWVSPPGDTILELIKERGANCPEIATQLGISEKQIRQLIQGKIVITKTLAQKLERVLGSTASFWMNRGLLYRQRRARLAQP